MGKQTKPKKTESYGKGHVTPVQIAFIVDRYLSDNYYPQTRSTFRSEASDLISRSPVQEVYTYFCSYLCSRPFKFLVILVNFSGYPCGILSLSRDLYHWNVFFTYNCSKSIDILAIFCGFSLISMWIFEFGSLLRNMYHWNVFFHL